MFFCVKMFVILACLYNIFLSVFASADSLRFCWFFFLQATLLSSHRSFLYKVDAIELSNSLSHRGDPLSMFVFSDSMEVRILITL